MAVMQNQDHSHFQDNSQINYGSSVQNEASNPFLEDQYGGSQNEHMAAEHPLQFADMTPIQDDAGQHPEH